ncbi:unnamed protein product [Gadus morhua 'NCC']
MLYPQKLFHCPLYMSHYSLPVIFFSLKVFNELVHRTIVLFIVYRFFSKSYYTHKGNSPALKRQYVISLLHSQDQFTILEERESHNVT